jgi:ERCC4-related helicase
MLTVLRRSPLTALEVARAVGLSTSSQVNSRLYTLEKTGEVIKRPSGKGQAWLWCCVDGMTSAVDLPTAPSPPLITSKRPPTLTLPTDQKQPPIQSKQEAYVDIPTDQKQLYDYQRRIITQVSSVNSIVMIPTGTGKTRIAGEVISIMERKSRERGSDFTALFVVPKRPLVEQQAEELRAWTKLDVRGFHGGLSLPSQFQILVTTPKAFLMQQARGESHLSWSRISLVVFDEVHHVLKDDPMRKLALSISNSKSVINVQILGLSASLSYAMTEGKVTLDLQRLCNELRVLKMASATPEELAASGFTANTAEPELLAMPLAAPGAPRDERKPHLMHASFFSRVNNQETSPFVRDYVAVLKELEACVACADSTFRSPLSKPALAEWGEYAHKKATNSQLPRTTRDMFLSLEWWFEALRLLVTSWEEGEDMTASFLLMCHHDTSPTAAWPAGLHACISAFWSEHVSKEYERFTGLKQLLADKMHSAAASGRTFKGIVFVQQRVSTHILQHVINSDPAINSLFRAKILYSPKVAATPSLSLSPSSASSAMSAFKTDACNLLITTDYAEEGINVPKANCVIRFDPVQHSVSFVQGRGRAREQESTLVVLAEREDRKVSDLQNVEQLQLRIVAGFKPSAPTAASEDKEKKAQRSRELNAWPYLEGKLDVQLFTKKTKTTIVEQYKKNSNGHWCCDLSYTSCLRVAQGQAIAITKLLSRRNAEQQLAAAILSQGKV